MTETETQISDEEYERAIQAITKVANAVSKCEWNYERLKSKREKLLMQAMVSYWKSISLKDDFLYPIRLSYSTYEYDCGMLNENLTKELLSLDGVNSNGNVDIRTKRKEQVMRILELQDRITQLHKSAMKLSVFYRSCVSQSRYQALLGQESDGPEIQTPSSPMTDDVCDTPPLKKQPSLKRNKSVHQVPLLSPEEFEERKKHMSKKRREKKKVESEVVEVEEKEKEMKRLEKEKEEELKRLEEEEKEREEEEKEKEREEELKRLEEEELKRLEEEELKRLEEEELKRLEEEELKRLEEEKRKQAIRNRLEELRRREMEEESKEEEEEEEEEEEGIVEEEEEIESDYHPHYQWLQQGNRLILILRDVEFDQKSLRCITKPGVSSPKVIIQGYRIVKVQQPHGYYYRFYNMAPSYQYIPFTTVIPLPSVPVDLSEPPTAMYYDDESTLQITYSIAQPKPRRSRPHKARQGHHEASYNPFYPHGHSSPYTEEYYQPRERYYSPFDSAFPSFGGPWF